VRNPLEHPGRRMFLFAAPLAFSGAGLCNPPPNEKTPALGALPYRGNQHRPTRDLLNWHGQAPREPAREPDLPIVDAHHHLFGTDADALYYRREDMESDLSSGHKIIGTLYVAAYGAGWRTDGPPAMRSVGEVERIVALSATPLTTPQGPCRLAAGIVSEVNVRLGDAVDEVLQAHVAAGKGRLRGVGYYATYHDSDLGKFILPPHAEAGAYQRDPELVTDWIRNEFPRIRAEAEAIGTDIFFGDEAAVRSDYCVGMTWSPVGATPVIKTTSARFKLNLLPLTALAACRTI
jgi:hypothetical protein